MTIATAGHAELDVVLRRVEALEAIRERLEKFVPRAVRQLIAGTADASALDRREADVSVLFVDIVGYTRLGERLDPDRTAGLVERYLGAFLEEVLDQGGDVNELTGDRLMVLFQDPDPCRHARAALRAGLAILGRARQLNATLAEPVDPVRLHVGVNSGRASVGVTRIGAAAGARWTYTASGPVTNLAARLAELGTGDAVMVGPGTHRRVAGEFAFEPMGRLPLRNLGEPVAVHRLAVAPASGVETVGRPARRHPRQTAVAR